MTVVMPGSLSGGERLATSNQAKELVQAMDDLAARAYPKGADFREFYECESIAWPVGPMDLPTRTVKLLALLAGPGSEAKAKYEVEPFRFFEGSGANARPCEKGAKIATFSCFRSLGRAEAVCYHIGRRGSAYTLEREPIVHTIIGISRLPNATQEITKLRADALVTMLTTADPLKQRAAGHVLMQGRMPTGHELLHLALELAEQKKYKDLARNAGILAVSRAEAAGLIGLVRRLPAEV